MPKSDAVWGIDIGNCSLKALRCRPGSRDNQIIADAFDFIEYPKILTQPGAEPEELVADALSQFLSRNSVRGDRVAISAPGHSGLVRFITLPPVETKKIPALVEFEVKQQIPFELSEVVWDYHQMSGGLIEEGFALDTEIGLFAMKRDQVERTLGPFENAGIELDVVQLAPVALFNYLVFDQMPDLPPPDEFDPESPPPSIVILSVGTEATDLVVSNGFRVRQRSIPLGGNHFTKALTKELKLTFAKAEHLKRNATTAQDPKAVFQAMRPVFNDLLTEIQRSISYFTSLDRNMEIRKVVAMGNAIKLPGLRRYLEQSLGHKVERVDQFRGLAGSEVTDAPAFKENALSFVPCYGLALQGLRKASIQANLLPGEIVKDRMIREKKPWAIAAAAVLLLGCTISFVSFSRALGTVDEKRFGATEQSLESVKGKADQFQNQFVAAQGDFDKIDDIGQNLVSNVEGRLLWLELLKFINRCLPKDPSDQPPADITQRRELRITSVECQRTEDLSVWYTWVDGNGWLKFSGGAADATGDAGSPGGLADPAATTTETAEGGDQLSGEGWVIQLTGHHFRNPPRAGDEMGNRYVVESLIENLRTLPIPLPVGFDKDGNPQLESFTPQELGIFHPVLIKPQQIKDVTVRNPNVDSPSSGMGPGMMGPGMMGPGAGMMPGMGTGAGAELDAGGYEGDMAGMGGAGRPGRKAEESDEPREIKLRRLDFVVQFAWKETKPSERLKSREEQEAGQVAEAAETPAQ